MCFTSVTVQNRVKKTVWAVQRSPGQLFHVLELTNRVSRASYRFPQCLQSMRFSFRMV